MNKIIFLDTLATGTNPDRCGIYRIGGIYTENGKEKQRFEFRMRPYRNARISDQSLWISGESRSSLVNYEDEETAFGKFIEMVSSHVNIRNPKDKIYLAGFNSAAFDVPFLKEWFRRCGNEQFRNYFYVQTIDLMSLSAFALMETRSNMPDFHLETAARYLGVRSVSNESYDCVENAKTALDMYRLLLKRFGVGEQDDTAVAEEVISNF